MRSGKTEEATHVGDDAVERAARIAKPVLARRELAEVARRFGDDFVVELEDDAARGLVGDGDIKLCEVGFSRDPRRMRK